MSFALKVALFVAVAYAGLVALVYLVQDKLVYYPNMGRAIVATPEAYGLPFETLSIETGDGERLHAWWIPTERARGAVLLFHGNAGNISQRIDYAAMFSRLKFSTLLVDYRGYGQSTGSPSEEGTYRDAVASWRWLTETKGIGPSDIVVFGESLGGAVAAWLAAKHAPRALVLASTFTSVPDLGAEVYTFLPVRLLSRYKYETLSTLPRVEAPVLIAHSRGDEIVPFSHAEKLFAAARGPKQLLELHGGHNDGFVFMRPEWVNALGAFLERTTGKTVEPSAADGRR
ncbi:MAG: alpha/beta hydrolase [Burkholderiales bacterium]